jgi:hypothetical protein
MSMIAAAAQFANSGFKGADKPALQATQQLQQGISPGVRASGPFAKQIAQAQKQGKPNNLNFQQPRRGDAVTRRAMAESRNRRRR